MYSECLKVEQETVGDSLTRGGGEVVNLDFEEMSSIPKTSRGATGDGRRSRLRELMREHEVNTRQSADLYWQSNHGSKKWMLNGKQMDIADFDDA